MFDATAEALYNYSLTLVPTSRSYPRSELNKLPLPLAHYLGSVLDESVDQKAASPNSAWLDANHVLVQTASKVWKTAAREGAQFPSRAWRKELRSASLQVLSYLVEPVETLVSIAYTGAATELESDVLLMRMAAFSPYPYFREVVESYVERKALDGIKRNKFEKLLRRIDKRMVSGFRPDDWMTLLEPLFELVATIPDLENGLPAGLLRRFFRAKGLDEIASGLDDSEVYDHEGLRKILSDAAEPVESAEDDAVLETVEETASVPTEGEQTTLELTKDNGAEPIWKRLAREHVAVAPLPDAIGIEIEDAEIIEEADVAVDEGGEPQLLNDEEGSNEEGSREEPLWKRLADTRKEKVIVSSDASVGQRGKAKPTQEERPEPLQHLEMRVLGSTATERRDWYIRHLTNGSETAYRAILEDLDNTKRWDEAWPILKKAYQANKVEIYSDAIVALTDAVEGRFQRLS